MKHANLPNYLYLIGTLFFMAGTIISIWRNR